MSNKCFWMIYLFCSIEVLGNPCLTPQYVAVQKNRNDIDRYVIEISDEPETYIPGKNYTITLKRNPEIRTHYGFQDFVLSVESYETPDGMMKDPNPGIIFLTDTTMTKYSPFCPNTVVPTNSFTKSEIEVIWQAPTLNSQCVQMKATVVENKQSWFSEDGDLTKNLCERPSEDPDTEPEVLEECRACGQAKYEMAFEGVWSRNMHPRDFPNNMWSTKFTEIIGASHTNLNSFWGYGQLASEGLKFLAETGNTTLLEYEIKQLFQNGSVHTIIMARELRFPNNTGTTYTNFRVDQQNHLVSVVSKISPSPDWVVGVSNFELCQSDGTWIPSRTVNLYPLDVGTMDGISYTSPPEPTEPQQIINRIEPQTDETSPFYGDEPIKKFAILRFTRLKTYPSPCEEETEEPNCEVSDWSEWEDCESDCFQKRTRKYVSEENTEGCEELLEETIDCECLSPEDRCKVTDFGSWSSCSANCGNGTRTRSRILDNDGKCKLTGATRKYLEENEACVGNETDCEIPTDVEEDTELCTTSPWSECVNATCETEGTKSRVFYRITGESPKDEEIIPCLNRQKETVTCTDDKLECATELSSESQTKEQYLVPIDCKMSKWTDWNLCGSNKSCPKGFQCKERIILISPKHNGRPCPQKLQRKRKCKKNINNESPQIETDIDCVLSKWKVVVPCNPKICGQQKQRMIRDIVQAPKGNGKPCEAREKEVNCPLLCL